jgi:uncharacterized membrane protein
VSERATRVAIGVVAVAGAAISGYLLDVRLSGGRLACTNGGCETVQSSRYSEIVGVPVAALGLVAYLALIATAVVRGALAAAAGTAIAIAGAVFGAYLLVVQLAVIGAVCEWCVASDALISLLAALALLRIRAVARAAVGA